VAAAAVALAARAGPPSEPASPFSFGGQQVAVLAGGGFALPLHSHRDVDDPRLLALFARWAIGLSDPLARGAFYEGNLELDVQPTLLLNYAPRFGWVAGGTLLLHYNFLRAGSIVPFIEGGGGGSQMTFHLDDQADGFTFPLEASIGLHALTFERGALTASLGYYHLSNAGREFPNYGVNAVMIRIGLLFFPGCDAAKR